MKTNDIFNFKRFGQYVLTDLKSCYSRMGIDILVCGFSGLFMFLFISILHLFGIMQFTHYGTAFSTLLFAILLFCICLIFGEKCYGYITDKKAGSLYTLLPASTLEKTLSILINALVLPLSFAIIYLGIDWIFSLVLPDYGEGILPFAFNLKENLSLLAGEAEMEGFNVHFMTSPWTYLDDILNFILIFVLGALLFKKNKTGMTFLALIAIGIVLSSLTTGIFAAFFFKDGMVLDLESWLETLPIFYEHLFFWDTLADLLGLVGLTVAIYFRLKTIKH